MPDRHTVHSHPWRKSSLFGDGPRRPLDRNEACRFFYLVHAYWRAGHLTPAFRDVALVLLRRVGKDGRLDPSHARIADDAGRCVATVKSALKQLAALGLVSWTRRLVRNGGRCEQTSNAYALCPGAKNPAPACEAKNWRGSLKKVFSRSSAAENRPSEGSDEWARWNAARQLAILQAMM